MGIKQLKQLIADNAPQCLRETVQKDHFGRKIAIDASMSLYQFLIAIRTGSDENQGFLANEAGEITSHLQGIFSRTTRLVELGIKPCYVFDGKPPTMKSGELGKRKERRQQALDKLEAATEEGDAITLEKMQKRTVTVTKEQTEDTKKLLRLMGIPVVEAPCEAEASCAAMAKAGVVWATATEDMDALTFGTPVMLKSLLVAEARKMPVLQISIDFVLSELGLTMPQFIDLCILLGCDYTESVRGIGPKRAFELIKKFGTLEEIVTYIKRKNATSKKPKYVVPENWPIDEVRALFTHPEVVDASELKLKWEDPDEEGLVQFLVKEKGFSEERVRSTVKRLRAHRGTATQGRLESFFGAPTVVKRSAPTKQTANSKKAKVAPKKSFFRK